MKKSKLLSMTLATLLTVSIALPAGTNNAALAAGSSTSTSSQSNAKKSTLLTKKAETTKKKTISNQKENPIAKKFKERTSGKKPAKAVPGEYIITYKKGVADSSIQSLHRKFSLKASTKLKSLNSVVVEVPKGKDTEAFVNELKANPNVASVQPNYFYQASGETANHYDQLWGLHNTGQSIRGIAGKEDIDLDVPEAWSTYKDLKEVVVGVIDTGVDINHPDLKDKIWTNKGEIAGDGIDNDGNGYIDDVHGWDFFNNDNTVFDALDGDDHGTHVSGTIAAALEGNDTSSNTGVVGVAPNVKIMPLKFLGPWGGDTAGAIAAIEYAKKMGVKLTNNSWGGDMYDPLLQQAIENCDCLFVAAAGNDGMDIDEMGAYPAAYPNSNILSVAAVDNQGKRANFSNYGTYSVDVAAPGVDVLSSVPKFPIDEFKKILGGEFGASAQITDPEFGFKAIVDGVGFEKISGENRQLAFEKALGYLKTGEEPAKILLVQDDEHDLASLVKGEPLLENYFKDYLSDYKEFLKDREFDIVTIPSNSSFSKSAGTKKLSDYDTVIWFTGHGFGLNSNEGTTLTMEDVALLEGYLKEGGSLMLTGQDVLSGQSSSSFVTSLLDLKVMIDIAPLMNTKGVEGSIYEGDSFNVDKWGSLFPPSDFIQVNGPNAKLSLDYVSEYSQAYDYYNGTSMAAPHATGAAALFMGLHSDMSPVFAKLYLGSQGTELPSLKGIVGSGKLVNAANINLFNDNTVPGLPLQKSILSGDLSSTTDKDDVFAVPLREGEAMTITLNGDKGSDFDLYVYSEGAEGVASAEGLMAYAETPGTSNEQILFIAPYTGFYYIDVYAFKGNGKYKLFAGNFGGAYENEMPVIAYSGNWELDENPGYSGEMASVLNSRGEVNFSFVGYSFEWQAFKAPNQGVADIYIDGVKQTPVSMYSPAFQGKQSVFKKEFQEYGKHSVKIAWTGKSDSAARKSASAINVDRFIVKDNPLKPLASYSASKKYPVVNWAPVSWATAYTVYRKESGSSEYTKLTSQPISATSFTDTSAKPGKTYDYAVSLYTQGEETKLSSSTRYTFDDDVKASMPIIGDKAKGSLNASTKDYQDVWKKTLEAGKTYEISLTGSAGTNFKLNVYKPGTTSIFGSTPAASVSTTGSAKKILFKPQKTGTYYLAPMAKTGSGSYTLAVAVQTTSHVENTAAAFKKAGTWSTVKTTYAYGGSFLQSKKAGSSISYTFTGTGVALYAMKDKTMGYADIYVDGKKVKQVDLYSAKRQYKQKIWEATNLQKKSHTVKIVVTGKKRSSATGTNVDLDALKITTFSPVK
ncbi:S8 family serine peptidase [Bacillus sp. FJAT-18017]|uniref:S8 family serine peptidase n=1 Tax=Bacillus sp. FJAT-18017 TaxID=1705566 RepID=UPI0006B018BB|nr:S8 family serine peptidase [Bacillus sp. FJAT-18017]